MVPCPWARDAAAGYRGEDVGVHLTLNAEFETYRWGPITHSPSLLDGDGGFPRTIEDAWDHADLDEVRRECRAQIERAIVWGFDVSHLASHLGTLAAPARVLRRLPRARGRLRAAAAARRRARPSASSASRSAGSPPRRASCSPTTSSRARPAPAGGVERALFDLEPGVTELYAAPGHRHRRAARRVQRRLGGPGRGPRARCAATRRSATSSTRSGAVVVGWRELRELQRSLTLRTRSASRPSSSASTRVDRGEHVEHQPEVARGLHPPLHERGARRSSSPPAIGPASRRATVSVRSRADAGAPAPTSATTPSSTCTCHDRHRRAGRSRRPAPHRNRRAPGRDRPIRRASRSSTPSLTPYLRSSRRSGPRARARTPAKRSCSGSSARRHRRRSGTSERASTYSSHGNVSRRRSSGTRIQ